MDFKILRNCPALYKCLTVCEYKLSNPLKPHKMRGVFNLYLKGYIDVKDYGYFEDTGAEYEIISEHLDNTDVNLSYPILLIGLHYDKILTEDDIEYIKIKDVTNYELIEWSSIGDYI